MSGSILNKILKSELDTFVKTPNGIYLVKDEADDSVKCYMADDQGDKLYRIFYAENFPSVEGPSTLDQNTDGFYTITDYDFTTEYVLVPIVGTITRDTSDITYNPGSNSGSCGFYINGKLIDVQVAAPIAMPPGVLAWASDMYNPDGDVYAVENGDEIYPEHYDGLSQLHFKLINDTPSANYSVVVEYLGVSLGAQSSLTVVYNQVTGKGYLNVNSLNSNFTTESLSRIKIKLVYTDGASIDVGMLQFLCTASMENNLYDHGMMFIYTNQFTPVIPTTLADVNMKIGVHQVYTAYNYTSNGDPHNALSDAAITAASSLDYTLNNNIIGGLYLINDTGLCVTRFPLIAEDNRSDQTEPLEMEMTVEGFTNIKDVNNNLPVGLVTLAYNDSTKKAFFKVDPYAIADGFYGRLSFKMKTSTETTDNIIFIDILKLDRSLYGQDSVIYYGLIPSSKLS